MQFRRATVVAIGLILGAALAAEETWVLQNEAAELTVAREGGALVSFRLAEETGGRLNPLDWAIPREEMPENNRAGAPFRGHFLCLGRWGGPTAGEQAAGVPHNGEAAMRTWDRLGGEAAGDRYLGMSVDCPLEGWQVERRVRLAAREALVEVVERVSNRQASGRFGTLVQHATLGGAFLTPGTLIDCNAGRGFNQALLQGSLEAVASHWPEGRADAAGHKLDLRRCDWPQGYVSTHVVEGKTGWVTAANPEKGLLIGYVWPAGDYPWLHLWHGVKEGRLWARGLEFGTTGLGDTVEPEFRARATLDGRHNLVWVDAGATVERRYTLFLLEVPGDFEETLAVEELDGMVRVRFRAGGAERTATLSWDTQASR